jgi:hypothetical protein
MDFAREGTQQSCSGTRAIKRSYAFTTFVTTTVTGFSWVFMAVAAVVVVAFLFSLSSLLWLLRSSLKFCANETQLQCTSHACVRSCENTLKKKESNAKRSQLSGPHDIKTTTHRHGADASRHPSQDGYAKRQPDGQPFAFTEQLSTPPDTFGSPPLVLSSSIPHTQLPLWRRGPPLITRLPHLLLHRWTLQRAMPRRRLRHDRLAIHPTCLLQRAVQFPRLLRQHVGFKPRPLLIRCLQISRLACLLPPARRLHPAQSIHVQLAFLVGLVVLLVAKTHVAQRTAGLITKVPDVLPVVRHACAATVDPFTFLADADETTAGGGGTAVDGRHLGQQHTTKTEHG